jgi:hypothetical protein
LLQRRRVDPIRSKNSIIRGVSVLIAIQIWLMAINLTPLAVVVINHWAPRYDSRHGVLVTLWVLYVFTLVLPFSHWAVDTVLSLADLYSWEATFSKDGEDKKEVKSCRGLKKFASKIANWFWINLSRFISKVELFWRLRYADHLWERRLFWSSPFLLGMLWLLELFIFPIMFTVMADGRNRR